MIVNSKSLLLLWRIAELEALNLKSEYIEPPHFFLALLKIVDINIKRVFSDSNKNTEEIHEIISDISEIKKIFLSAELNTTKVRRTLRKEISIMFSPNRPSEFTRVRRSQKSRSLFCNAELIAQNESNELLPLHILIVLIKECTPSFKEVCLKSTCDIDKVKKAIKQQPQAERDNKPTSRAFLVSSGYCELSMFDEARKAFEGIPDNELHMRQVIKLKSLIYANIVL
jgi:hypothetical protein